MKYMGSKSRVAKYIVPILQNEIDTSGYKTYIEPFAGGMNIIDKIQCERRLAFDLNPYLIALFQHLQNGGTLPDTISRDEYVSVRETPDKYEPHVVGYTGFLASYNGRFFDGGYAQPAWEKTSKGGHWRNYYAEAKQNIERQTPLLSDVVFGVADYRSLTPNNTIIYCDPPYKGTTKFRNARQFDIEEFWEVMRRWSNDNTVFVSEQTAPSDFDCVWENQ